MAAGGAAALAVAAILWTWGAARYPAMPVGGTTVPQAASNASVPAAVLVSLGAAAVLLVPSLWLLYAPFQRGSTGQPSSR
ncbi:hypothetical protein ACWCRF_12935 [Streptomyces sp. NPDC002405]|uniref:hypothetical protein n=1 Tax=unclassified Streptomyces TaxID=2593676 RepID=UPI0036AB2813